VFSFKPQLKETRELQPRDFLSLGMGVWGSRERRSKAGQRSLGQRAGASLGAAHSLRLRDH
jgi:hypothetical protein